MLRIAKILLASLVLVVTISALGGVSFKAFTYFNDLGRQVCVQDFATGAEVCHAPKAGEKPGTSFVLNPSR